MSQRTTANASVIQAVKALKGEAPRRRRCRLLFQVSAIPRGCGERTHLAWHPWDGTRAQLEGLRASMAAALQTAAEPRIVLHLAHDSVDAGNAPRRDVTAGMLGLAA
ncbi:hypothetical protein [Rhodanobacter sp. FW106-PBR-R2A-1-13]|uniref:hypothetical protein n=1 Tax=Rhodanobacter sp. FW106-PBR-R2A-1-13 TaxID=3454845 RepID=UPI0034E5799D